MGGGGRLVSWMETLGGRGGVVSGLDGDPGGSSRGWTETLGGRLTPLDDGFGGRSHVGGVGEGRTVPADTGTRIFRHSGPSDADSLCPEDSKRPNKSREASC